MPPGHNLGGFRFHLGASSIVPGDPCAGNVSVSITSANTGGGNNTFRQGAARKIRRFSGSRSFSIRVEKPLADFQRLGLFPPILLALSVTDAIRPDPPLHGALIRPREVALAERGPRPAKRAAGTAQRHHRDVAGRQNSWKPKNPSAPLSKTQELQDQNGYTTVVYRTRMTEQRDRRSVRAHRLKKPARRRTAVITIAPQADPGPICRAPGYASPRHSMSYSNKSAPSTRGSTCATTAQREWLRRWQHSA